MTVARVVAARLQADRMYREGYTGELRCQTCGKTQHVDLFTAFLKGDAGGYEMCCGSNTALEPLKGSKENKPCR